MLVATVDLPTPPFGLATTTTGISTGLSGWLCAMLAGMDESSQGANRPIYLLGAHPNWRESRVNRRLYDAAQGTPKLEVRDLYASYPDYDIDVEREQKAAAAADLLVLLHPVQWYS